MRRIGVIPIPTVKVRMEEDECFFRAPEYPRLFLSGVGSISLSDKKICTALRRTEKRYEYRVKHNPKNKADRYGRRIFCNCFYIAADRKLYRS